MFSSLGTMLERFLEAKSCMSQNPYRCQKQHILFFLFENHVCMSTVHVCCVYSMYALYVCIICMYYMYVLYVCIICMYSMYVLYAFLKHSKQLKTKASCRRAPKQKYKVFVRKSKVPKM